MANYVFDTNIISALGVEAKDGGIISDRVTKTST